jgi:hypothetical protein
MSAHGAKAEVGRAPADVAFYPRAYPVAANRGHYCEVSDNNAGHAAGDGVDGRNDHHRRR